MGQLTLWALDCLVPSERIRERQPHRIEEPDFMNQGSHTGNLGLVDSVVRVKTKAEFIDGDSVVLVDQVDRVLRQIDERSPTLL